MKSRDVCNFSFSMRQSINGLSGGVIGVSRCLVKVQ